MARRRGRKRSRRKSKQGIPVGQALTLGIPIYQAFETGGLTLDSANVALYNITGFSSTTQRWIEPKKGLTMAIILLAESTIGRKLANRTGANKMLKKMTAGYLQLF